MRPSRQPFRLHESVRRYFTHDHMSSPIRRGSISVARKPFSLKLLSMDNITHTLAGLTLGNALAPASCKKRGFHLALALGSNLPDIDFFLAKMLQSESFLVRRQLTHSLLTLPVFSLLVALLHISFFRKTSFREAWSLYFFSMLFHVFLDLVNSYGVCLLYPLSRYRFELSWIFIIDLWIWLILLLTSLGAVTLLLLRKPRNATNTWRAGATVLLAYILFCGFSNFSSLNILKKTVQKENTKFIYVFPEVFRPDYFRGVALSNENLWSIYLIHFAGGVQLRKQVRTYLDDPLAQVIRNSRPGRELEWFFKAPVWVRTGPRTVTCSDLRFQTLLLSRGRKPFLYQFRYDDKGTITRTRVLSQSFSSTESSLTSSGREVSR